MKLLDRRRARRLDRLVGPPMFDREVGDLVFVEGISWVWGRIYLFSKDRRAAIVDVRHAMFWAGSNAILDEPPINYRHLPRLARPAG